jgi:DNA invertase Pin-like site-specific DNA recombinase
VVEDVASGKSMAHRPGLTGVLEALRAEEATVLMSAKLDRLSRSVQDFAELLERAQRERWGLVALDAPADTTSPQGEALAQMLVVFSQLERRLIGQRTKEALAGLRAQGVRLGRPQVLPRQVVKRIVLERASGRTLQAIADGLNGDGVPTAHGGSAWWPSTVGNVLAGNVKAGA